MTEPRTWADAEADVRILAEVIQDIHWMARRYADGRSTFAPSTFNYAIGRAMAVGVELVPVDDTLWAKDGMGPDYEGLIGDEYKWT
jgi:hypothetical protein